MDTPQSSNLINITTIDHDLFIKSLEKHGSSINNYEKTWSLIAADMKQSDWCIDEVKTYAYWYMQQLHQIAGGQTEKNCNSDDEILDTKMEECRQLFESNDHFDNHNILDYNNEWSYEEKVLFNTLLVTYDCDTVNRLEVISSLIPFKNESQCRERWTNIEKERSE